MSLNLQTTPPHHGGKLRAAAEQYAIPLAEWLDLSTAINPNGWPVPTIPAECWARLPEACDGLEEVARLYYGATSLLTVAGSQAAIQALPQLRPPSRVGLLAPAYAEHGYVWQRSGHTVVSYSIDEIERAVATSDVLILINPNNPTGVRFSQAQLLGWHKIVARRGGWLIVDEAFMDSTPDESLCHHSHHTGLIVLRSLGKFFGLAGARIGFVCAAPPLLMQLSHLLGPWATNAPARYVATLALQDKVWQQQAQQQLQLASIQMQQLLREHHLPPAGGCPLFQWILNPDAEKIHQHLAKQAILTRLFIEPMSLRFGLPKNTADWQRLAIALTSIPGLKQQQR